MDVDPQSLVAPEAEAELVRAEAVLVAEPLLDRSSSQWLGLTVFLRYAVLAIAWPHVTRWLKIDLKVPESTFALIFGSADLASLLTQPLWGLLADRAKRRRTVLRFLMFGSGAAFIVLGLYGAVMPLALLWIVIVLATVFQTSTLPILNSIVLRHLGISRLNLFPYYRVLGSLSFMLVMFIVPTLALDARFLGWPRTSLFILGGAVSIGSILLTQWTSPPSGPRIKPNFGDVNIMLRDRDLRILYLAIALFWISFGGSFVYIGPYFEALGGTDRHYSLSWGFNVLGEIPMALTVPWFVRRWGMRSYVVGALLFDSVRYALVGFVRDPLLLAIVWSTGGFPTVGYIVVIPMFIGSLAPSRLRSTAQNIATSLNSLGSITGLIWIYFSMHHFAGPKILTGYSLIYWRTSVGAAVAGVVVWLFVREKRQNT